MINEKGAIGSLSSFVIAMLLVATAFGFVFIGGFDLPKHEYPTNPSEVIPIDEIDDTSNKSLQLKTIKFKDCTSTVAIDLVLDRSGSMISPTQKFTKLKEGALTFVSKLSDESLIGMQSFASNATLDVPIGKVANNKSIIVSKINQMQAGGVTHTRDAMLIAKQELERVMHNFPDHKFYVILLSDGVPNAPPYFDPSQMPNDVATQIKNMGVGIFTIIYIGENDTSNQTRLKQMMESVASTPQDSYLAPTIDQLEKILDQIAVKICK